MKKNPLTKEFDNLKNIANESIDPNELNISEIYDNELADNIDRNLSAKSEDSYIELAKQIVKNASDQLSNQNESKSLLKKMFTIFFIAFISSQYVVLACLLFFKFFFINNLSDTIILTYITAVFVETLGAIVIMIRYAFNSDQEVQILNILTEVISRYKKYSEK